MADSAAHHTSPTPKRKLLTVTGDMTRSAILEDINQLGDRTGPLEILFQNYTFPREHVPVYRPGISNGVPEALFPTLWEHSSDCRVTIRMEDVRFTEEMVHRFCDFLVQCPVVNILEFHRCFFPSFADNATRSEGLNSPDSMTSCQRLIAILRSMQPSFRRFVWRNTHMDPTDFSSLRATIALNNTLKDIEVDSIRDRASLVGDSEAFLLEAAGRRPVHCS